MWQAAEVEKMQGRISPRIHHTRLNLHSSIPSRSEIYQLDIGGSVTTGARGGEKRANYTPEVFDVKLIISCRVVGYLALRVIFRGSGYRLLRIPGEENSMAKLAGVVQLLKKEGCNLGSPTSAHHVPRRARW